MEVPKLIKFVVSAKVKDLENTFGPALKQMRPHVPEHKFAHLPESIDASPAPGPDEVLLLCGNKVLAQYQALGVFAKNRTVDSLRGLAVGGPKPNSWYMVTYDAYRISVEPDKGAMLAWDVSLAVRLLTTGSLEPVLGDYKYVSDYADLISRVEKIYAETGQAVYLSFDTETEGLVPYNRDKRLVSLSFTLEKGTAEVLYLGRKYDDPIPLRPSKVLREQLDWLLNSPKVKLRLANGKFDMIWLKVVTGLTCTNFTFDNCLAGSLLDENRSNSQNIHTKVYVPLLGGYDDKFNGTVDKAHMEAVPPEKLLPYAGGDTDAAQQVGEALRVQLIAQPSLTKFYMTVLHPAARAFETLEMNGVLVDQEKYAALAQDLKEDLKESEKKILDLLPFNLKVKYRDKLESQLMAGRSILTPAIKEEFFFGTTGLGLKPYLFTEKSKKPSTAGDHLKMFSKVAEAKDMIEEMERMGSSSKTLSTYVIGFLKHLCDDGKFHPSYMLHHGGYQDSDDEGGTVSGRLAARDPAFQTLPKHTKWSKRLRECLIPDEGMMMFEVDYSQGELRVAACVAPELNMIAAYKEGMDLHLITGSLANKMTVEQAKALMLTDKALYKTVRQGGKAGNFGLLYGMQAEGFQSYAWNTYGVAMTLQEATEFREAFFKKWPGLEKYHNNQRATVNKYSCVESPMGRVRHLPQIKSWDEFTRSKAVRQAINSPIQATLSDMMIWAIALIDAELPRDTVRPIGMIHDATIGLLPKATCMKWIPQIIGIMENLPFEKLGWAPQLRFPVDWKMGDKDMAHLYEPEEFAVEYPILVA